MIEYSKSLAAVPHGFFGRPGGVSEGDYSTLNCGFGTGDSIDAVMANRRVAAQNLGDNFVRILTPTQPLGAEVAVVERAWKSEDDRPPVDAMVTKLNIPIGVLTADCPPILLSDREEGIVAAVHGSWRGIEAGILEQTLYTMYGLGAQEKQISVVIGPSIQQQSYEVDLNFREMITRRELKAEILFMPGKDLDHFQFDLPGYARLRLAQFSLNNIEIICRDTFLDIGYFSFRRRKIDNNKGLQVSAICNP